MDTKTDYTKLSDEQLDTLSKEKSAAYHEFRTSKEKEFTVFFNSYSPGLLDNCSFSENSLKFQISKTPGVDINSIFMPGISIQTSWKPEDNNKITKLEIDLHNAFERSDLMDDNDSKVEHNRKFSTLCILMTSHVIRKNLRELIEKNHAELRKYNDEVYEVMSEIRRRKNEKERLERETKHQETYQEALNKIREWIKTNGEDAYVQIYDSSYNTKEIQPWNFVYRGHAVAPVIETRGGRDVFILDYQPHHHRGEECKYVHIRNLKNHEGKKILDII